MLIEVFISINHLSPEIMWDFFTLRRQRYDLRCGQCLVIPDARTTRAINSFFQGSPSPDSRRSMFLRLLGIIILVFICFYTLFLTFLVGLDHDPT